MPGNSGLLEVMKIIGKSLKDDEKKSQMTIVYMA